LITIYPPPESICQNCYHITVRGTERGARLVVCRLTGDEVMNGDTCGRWKYNDTPLGDRIYT
jgi:hypothetical protein